MKFNQQRIILPLALLALGTAGTATAQGGAGSFEAIAAQAAQDVKDAEAQLTALRQRFTEETLPLNKQLSELQSELIAAQAELADIERQYNDGALKLSNLTKSIDDRTAEADYLANQFGEYGRNFKERLQAAEKQRYQAAVDAARLAPENPNLTQSEVYAEQAKLLDVALERLGELGGGTSFEGDALDTTGKVRGGEYVLIGPIAFFRSADGTVVGTAEKQIMDAEPRITVFTEEADIAAASAAIAAKSGTFPVDTTLGNAHKIAATKETLLEHVKKGGAIIWPILGMAALALLVALLKWLQLLFVRRPSKKRVNAVIAAIAEGDREKAELRVQAVRGPTGKMLHQGLGHLTSSRELMEDVMYERILVQKTRLEKALPFIAVCAASSPLLGLLGTVTGIIETFKQITVFGSGDVKSLSGGISSALITTKFGLIVAIPSLLLHAYLSRKVKGIVTEMETSALRVANEVAGSDAFGEKSVHKTGSGAGAMLRSDGDLVRGQVSQVLTDMLGPLANDASTGKVPETSGSGS